MSRLGDWWRRAKAKPQPSVFDSGRADIAYPELGRGGLAAFHRCETYLLREVVGAPSWGRRLASRGDAPATNGWVIMPGRVFSSLMDDTKGQGPGRAVMDSVVDWLASAGALRAMPEHTRDDIAESNVAERLRDFAEYHRSEGDARRDWDTDMWEVDPERMLAVYPHLAGVDADWERAAER